jgi:hypothetical protein
MTKMQLNENEHEELHRRVTPGFVLAGNQGRIHGTNDIRMAQEASDAYYRLLVGCDRQTED